MNSDPRPKLLLQHLDQYAEQQGSQLAYTYLSRDRKNTITYAALVRQSKELATRLVQKGLTDQPVVLLFPAGIEFIVAFLGCCYARAIPVPTNYSRGSHHFRRLAKVLLDCDAQAVLTRTDMREQVQSHLAEHLPGVSELVWLEQTFVDDFADHCELSVVDLPQVGEETLAFLQYTSGSTGDPKGVMVQHRNLAANIAAIVDAFGHQQGLILGGWLPQFHDMGLIGHILQPLFLGGQYVFMPPLDFILQPLRWLQIISDFKVQSCAAPDFAYQLCVDRIAEEDCKNLDLSSWSLALNGSEPVKQKTMERFAEKFAPFGFRREAFFPSYGLAEATLMVTGGRKYQLPVTLEVNAAKLQLGQVEVSAAADTNQPQKAEATPAQYLVSCGKPIKNHRIKIVDPNTLCQRGDREIGEIWFQGDSVAAGYWNKPEATRSDFHGFITGVDGPYLRTGDLGFMHDGELFVTGRMKDLIIIRGKNLHPHDIEYTLFHSSSLTRDYGAAVFVADDSQQEKLVAVQEISHRKADAKKLIELRQSLIEKVSIEHGVRLDDVQFIRANSLPKTSSGKVQRHLCRQYYVSNEFEFINE